MFNKIKKITKHLLYAIASNVLYGFAVYYIYVSLVGQSLLYVYVVNLALIVLFLALDEGTLKMWESKKIVMQLKKEKDIKKSYRYIQLYFDAFVSFKTILYLFYIFVLIAAQIIDFYPAATNENLMNFVYANNYSILLLVAADQLAGQFSKDRGRIKKISAKIKKDLTESQE